MTDIARRLRSGGILAGTPIATPAGRKPVETLQIGDLVETEYGGLNPIRWIGWRRHSAAEVQAHPGLAPIRIDPDALDDEIPNRPLRLARCHGVSIDGAFIHAKRLINGASITVEPVTGDITYYQIELNEHEAIIAAGGAVESLFEADDHSVFDNAASYPGPRLGTPTLCLPRMDEGFILQATQQRINERAGLETPPPPPHGTLHGFVDEAGPRFVAGWAQDKDNPEEPVCLDILVDGVRILRSLANLYREDLEAAGLGSGNHGFVGELPPDVSGVVEVRRTIDQLPLPFTSEVKQTSK